MARKATIIGEAKDVFGVVWDVRERRDTNHGFRLEIGWPRNAQRGRGGRGVATIITPNLSDYMQITVRLKDVDLPVGRNTIKRIRKDLDLYWSWDKYWSERNGDLQSMTLDSFCKKHNCSIGAASQRRRELKLFGK